MVKRGRTCGRKSSRPKKTVKKGGSIFGASMKALGSALVPLVFFQSARTYAKKSRGRSCAYKKTRRNKSRRRRR